MVSVQYAERLTPSAAGVFNDSIGVDVVVLAGDWDREAIDYTLFLNKFSLMALFLGTEIGIVIWVCLQ